MSSAGALCLASLGLEDVDVVVSDGKLSKHFLKSCEDADVEVL